MQSKQKQTQAQAAKTRFELENQIDEKEIYKFDEEAIDKLRAERPWKKDPDYFNHVKISAVALIKMVMHAKSGVGRPNGDVEIMGVLQGYPLGRTMYVMDVVPLPVEGTETRVNAGAEADEYMIAH